MARGSGATLGDALYDHARAHGYRSSIGRASSYQAKGWHAQLRQLTSSPRGYAAADDAGLSVSRKTLQRWLAESQSPSAENRARIADAYARMAGGFDPNVARGTYAISGMVQTGNDSRDRGNGSHAPLRVDASQGDWTQIRRLWDEGALSADDWENLFISDVIEEDLGEGSDGWGFPGEGYKVHHYGY